MLEKSSGQHYSSAVIPCASILSDMNWTLQTLNVWIFSPPILAGSFNSVNKWIQTKSQSLKKKRKITRHSIILHELQECSLWFVCQDSSQTSLIRAACSLHTMSCKKQLNKYVLLQYFNNCFHIKIMLRLLLKAQTDEKSVTQHVRSGIFKTCLVSTSKEINKKRPTGKKRNKE